MWIQGKTTIMKPTEPEEYPVIWSILAEPGVLDTILPDASTVTRTNLLERLGVAHDQTAHVFTVLAGEQIVGVKMISRIDPLHRSACIPCTAISRKSKGHGYGVDSTLALRDYAFRDLNLHRLWYTSFSPIDRAMKRADALGAAHEGTETAAFWVKGQWVDVHRFAFINKES